jgi:glycosyltransferase involved in cell wall biosynthesis
VVVPAASSLRGRAVVGWTDDSSGASEGGQPTAVNVPVSVVVITRDEERNIVRCLSSVEWARERIVVDSGSSDRTAQLAQELGARVFQHSWAGYGPQKNFGIAQATQRWILSIDADEEVTPQLACEIEQRLACDTPLVAFRLHRPTFFLGRPLRHYGRAPADPGQVRLFRKDSGRFDHRMVHETVKVSGPVGWLTAPLLHHSYPSVGTYWAKIHRYARLEALERANRRPNWWGRLVRATGKLVWMLLVRHGIFDGPPAWLWIAGQAYQEWLTA